MKTASANPSGKSSRSSRKGGTVFPYVPLIALAAFVIRFAVSYELIRHDPAAVDPSPITDMKTYLDLADGILRGKFPETFYYQPFYYAVFLPLCRLGGVWLLALVQSALGGFTVWLAGWCGELSGGRRAGIWAALLAALCAILIYYTPYALLEILQGFWIVLLAYLAIRVRGRDSARRWMALGLVLGCAVLTRGNCWCFLPVLLWLGWRRKDGWKKALRRNLLLIAFALLPQLPFIVYNSVRNGHLTGPSTASGAVLAFGNNPEGAPAGLEIPYPQTYELWLRHEKEISVPRRMWNWFCEEPAAFLEQQFEKCMLFWDAYDHPNNITEQNAKLSSIMRTFRFLPSGILLLLGLSGLFSGFYLHWFRRRKNFRLLAFFTLFYVLSICAFYILARFRIPVLPLLAVCGGVYLARLFRRNPPGVTIRLIGIGAAAVFLVYGFMPLYSFVYEPAVASLVRPGGVQTRFETSPYEWPGQPRGPYLLITDHSSVLKGGWGAVGNRFGACKFFRPKLPPRGSRALLVLPVFGPDGGRAVLTVNGERQMVQTRDRMIRAEVPLRIENGTVRLDLSLSSPDGEWTCAVDGRRNYGRTVLDGKAAPCELVAFLICPVAEKNDRTAFSD